MKIRKTISIIVAVAMIAGILFVTACSGDGVGIDSVVDNGDGTFTMNLTDGSSFTTDDLTGPKGDDGIAGIDGTNGTDGVDGMSITWEGTWSSIGSYSVNDMVENEGSSYICIKANRATIDTEPGVGVNWATYWDLSAQEGIQGVPGPNMIVAMGTVLATSGTIASGTGYNVTSSSWNATDSEYVIVLPFNYTYLGYVTLVTLNDWTAYGNGVDAHYYSNVTNDLTVQIYDSGGNPIRGSFSFMILDVTP